MKACLRSRRVARRQAVWHAEVRKVNADSRVASVERIDALYHQFARNNDRRGQHQAQLMALIGKNRAEGIGKLSEARIFTEWLIAHLETERCPARDRADEKESRGAERGYGDMSPYEATPAFA